MSSQNITPDADPGGAGSQAPQPDLSVVFGDAGRDARAKLTAEHLATLALPPDDMWAAFADQADAAALMLEGQLIGSAAVDADGALHHFFVRRGFEELSNDLFDVLRSMRPINELIVSTTDSGALSTLLPAALDTTPVALLYTHETESTGHELGSLRPATETDHQGATSLVTAATGGPAGFVGPYLAERIDRQELMIHESDGEMVATGERRLDQHSIGCAHLGMVVAADWRGRGLGGGMMNSLVSMCREEQLTPLCSTEPDNLAAQRVIRQAGFRSRHTIFRSTLRPAAT